MQFVDNDAKAAPRRQQKCRNWCFTDNHCRSPVLEAIVGFGDAPLLPSYVDPTLRYLYFSKEEGENKTPHWQGYISFTSQKTMSAVKAILKCNQLHLEQANGTAEDNESYINHTGKHASKPGLLDGPYSLGERPPRQGQRNDIIGALQTLNEHKSLKRVAEDHGPVFVKYHSGLEKYKSLIIKPPRIRTPFSVSVYWGPTGTGKTWRAANKAPDDTAIISRGTNNNVWWDNYDNNQKVIILDEFRGGFLRPAELLRVLDPYEFSVCCKGGRRNAFWEEVIITSNLPPWMWYKDTAVWELPDGSDGPLKRRCNIVEYMGQRHSDSTYTSKDDYLEQLKKVEKKSNMEGHGGSDRVSHDQII